MNDRSKTRPEDSGDLSNRQRQREIDKSKQAKPKL
jgi:hypothetical protein